MKMAKCELKACNGAIREEHEMQMKSIELFNNFKTTVSDLIGKEALWRCLVRNIVSEQDRAFY